MSDNVRVRGARQFVGANVSEIAFGVAALLGWLSLTIGLRTVLHGAAQRAVWPLSIGVLLLSACGWGFVGRLAFRGLYVIAHQKVR